MATLALVSGVVYGGANFGMAGAFKRKARELERKAGEERQQQLRQGKATLDVSGVVFKGPVSGATVTFYWLNTDGAKGTVLATATTAADGTVSANLYPAPVNFPFLVEVTGGSYIDEVTGATLFLSSSHRLTVMLPGGTTRFVVSVLTNMAAERAVELVAGGAPLASAIEAANAGVAQQYCLVDIISTFPARVTDASGIPETTLDERCYGLVLGGFSELANGLDVDPMELADKLAEDASDGTLDGNGPAGPITMPRKDNTQGPLPPDAGVGGMNGATTTFSGSGDNASGVNPPRTNPNPNHIGGDGIFYIETTAVPAWISMRNGTFALRVAGGATPFTWSVVPPGAQPAWMTVSADGTLSGTPPLTANVRIELPFKVRVTDANGIQREMTIVIWVVPPPPTITTINATGYTGMPFSQTIATASGGIPGILGYRFSRLTYAEALPPGLNLNSNGVLSGTPTTPGTYTFTVCVVDSVGFQSCAPVTVTIMTINPGPPGGSCTSCYDGTYTIACNYEYELWEYPIPGDPPVKGATQSASFTATVTLECLAQVMGVYAMRVVSASVSDPYFGCTSGCVPTTGGANLPDNPPTVNEIAVVVMQFPNGSGLGFGNSPLGSWTVSADCKTLSGGGVCADLCWVGTNASAGTVFPDIADLADARMVSWSMVKNP